MGQSHQNLKMRPGWGTAPAPPQSLIELGGDNWARNQEPASSNSVLKRSQPFAAGTPRAPPLGGGANRPPRPTDPALLKMFQCRETAVTGGHEDELFLF